MAAIKMDRKELGSIRFARLQEQMGWDRAHTLGALAMFWADTRAHGVEATTFSRLVGYAPVVNRMTDFVDAMVCAGYVQQQTEDAYLVVDNVGVAARQAARQALARKAGAASVAKRKAKPRAKKAAAAPTALVPAESVDTELQAACRATWAAYARAYQAKTGTEPQRNAKVNALVKQLVMRLGHEEAPQVAAFYVGHPQTYYSKRIWPLDALVKDAEPMRTQWARGAYMTSDLAHQADQGSHYQQRMQRLEQLAQEER